MPKCSYRKHHCRKSKTGSKAKSPCATKKGLSGTRIRGYYSPKGCTFRHHNPIHSATMIQRALRKMNSRKGKSLKRKSSSPPSSPAKRSKSSSSSMLSFDFATMGAKSKNVKVNHKYKANGKVYIKLDSKGKHKLA